MTDLLSSNGLALAGPDVYRCAFCERVISSWDAETHVRSKDHVRKRAYAEWCSQSLAAAPALLQRYRFLEPVGSMSSEGWVPEFRCTLCNKNTGGDESTIQEHVAMQRHKSRAGEVKGLGYH